MNLLSGDYERMGVEYYPTSHLCPVKGGRRCDGRKCVWAVPRPKRVECEIVAAEQETGGPWEYVTAILDWVCSATREDECLVDSRQEEYRRPYEGPTLPPQPK